MITPKKNDDYQFDFLKIHKQLQEEIIRDIARRISVTDFTLTETARWQAEKAMQCGILYDEVLRQVGKKTAISRKEIEAIFDDARLEVFDYDEELLAVAGYSVQSVKNLSPAMKRIMAAAISKTRDDVENLTMTTAVTSQASYISACDLAHMQIVSGAFSYQDAIRNAIKKAAADGVSVIYPSGHESSLDAAVRRAVLTGVNQSCGRLQEMRATELGCDLMEITAHLGSRPDHALWQGQVVSLSGRAGYLSLSDIGYGDVRGFQGANCRHNWYMFFEGVSSPAYSQDELREWREGTVSFDGVQIPLYEAIQKQRSMERAIRRSKQELVALDEAVKSASDVDTKQTLELEFERAAVRLKGQEARLSDFCEKTGLDRDRYREQVFAAKTERRIRGFGKSTSMGAVHSAKRYYSNFLREYNIDEPKTLDKYYKMKYNNSPAYRMLKRYTHMVDKGEVSPIMGFRYYHDRAKDIENNLIGLTTSNGIEIKDYSDHFVARMIGYSGLEDKFKQKRYNRPGVTIEEIRDCLTQGKTGKIQEHEKAGTSIVFADGKINVTVNPKTGTLIQTNRKGGE